MALKIPKLIYAGDSVTFTDTVSDYLAGDGWTLQYSITNGSNNYLLTSAANDDAHGFSITAETTTDWVAGSYKWAAFVTKGAEKITLSTDSIEIKPNFTAATDQRHHVEKVIDALEASLEGKASNDQQSMSINGRSIARFTPSELLMWRDKYRAELATIKRADRLTKGLGGTGKIYTRF